MAALYEGYTLCGLVPSPNQSLSGIQGIEIERDNDHVIVTDSTRSVTLYKVSDQKPLGSWTVKQGQSLTCPAVYNSESKEYVAVTDKKVIRIWKDEDMLLDKTFKATVSSDIWCLHCISGREPVVLFQNGAIRLLDALLAAPQQTVEDILGPDESIRWSTNVVAETQQFVIFTTEQKGDHLVYLQRLNPSSLQRYRLEREEPGLSPLSFSACCKDQHVYLLCLYPNGHLYQSVIPVRSQGTVEATLAFPRSLLLKLPVNEGFLEAASVKILDEAHIAVVGVPHPSAGAGKDFLCVWNTNFQTLQAGKEMAGKIYGQLWSYSNKFFIPHGKTLSVIPYECTKSSLASALGKLSQAKTEGSKAPASVPSWNTILHGEVAPPPLAKQPRETRTQRKSQSAAILTLDQILELIKSATEEEVQKAVDGFFTRAYIQDLQSSVGQLASSIVSRSLDEPSFYPSGTLAKLVRTQCLFHSGCPNLVLLALEKKDYFLCQLCLQFFQDIPEAVTCTCLRAFIGMSDTEAKQANLDEGSISFMESLTSLEPDRADLQNGFNPATVEDSMDPNSSGEPVLKTSEVDKNWKSWCPVCPVGIHKAALLNEILLTAYSDSFLLPHLKDLSSQHVILFLQYLQFLYLKYSQDAVPRDLGFRSPTLPQIMDWVCLLLDSHFTVLVMSPEVKDLLIRLQSYVQSQVKLYSELGKIESSLKELDKMKPNKDAGLYSIEIIELF
ncbi:nucleolar protein 11-like [Neosynchiropus ocellatus]